MSVKQKLYEQYANAPMVHVDAICRDYFHMTTDKFMRKVNAGEIRLPIVRMYDDSQKAAKAISLEDLAEYLDGRYAKAKKEHDTLYG